MNFTEQCVHLTNVQQVCLPKAECETNSLRLLLGQLMADVETNTLCLLLSKAKEEQSKRRKNGAGFQSLYAPNLHHLYVGVPMADSETNTMFTCVTISIKVT